MGATSGPTLLVHAVHVWGGKNGGTTGIKGVFGSEVGLKIAVADSMMFGWMAS